MERHATPPPPSSCPHLLPAAAALLVILLATGGVERFVRRNLPAHMDRFTVTMAPAKLTGNILQKTAFRAPDILPIYGSSELDRPAENRPDTFFLKRPTGFSAFPIGRADNTSLVILQKLAAAGHAAHGRKVAIIISATWFQRSLDGVSLDRNLRPLQLGTWVFGHGLRPALKRDIARRLLTYPQLLEKQPLLGLSLESMANPSMYSRARLALLTPLGRAQNFLLERLEYWMILRDLPSIFPSSSRQREQARRQRFLNAPTTPPDWAQLTAEAEAHDRALGDADPYSVGNPTLADEQRQVHPQPVAAAAREKPGVSLAPPVPPDHDDDFARRMADSGEWADFELLLRVLHDLRMDALIVDQPFNGLYSNAAGNSAGARRRFYDRLAATVRAAGFPLVDFSAYEEDKYFFNDYNHPSAKGWIFYDHAFDDFYHGRGPAAAAVPRS